MPAWLFLIIFISSWENLSSKNGDLPVPPGSDQQTMSILLDVDGDGTSDFVIGCRRKGPALFWYRRQEEGWKVYVLDPATLPLEAGGTYADIDGDGDRDLVAGEDSSGHKIYWWENPQPDYDPNVPWKRHEIKNSDGKKHHDQIFGDFLGEGKLQLIFWNQGANRLMLARIPADPKAEPWPAVEIWSSGKHAEGIGAGDIDGDGKLDLLAGGRWFKHEGETRFAAYEIDDAQRDARHATADFDGDGRTDAVMVLGDGVGRLKWYAQKGDPKVKSSWIAHDLLGFDVKHGHSLAAADFDKNGKPDIFCGEMRKWTANDDHPEARMWIFYGDGKGNFIKTEVASGFGVHEAKVGDLDGDGWPDILAKPYNWDTPRIDIWLNRRPERSRFGARAATAYSEGGRYSAKASCVSQSRIAATGSLRDRAS